jgi:hypothetical protein
MGDNKELEGLTERLNVLFARSQMSIQDFSDKIHVDRGQFGKVLNGKLGVTLKQVLEISSQFKIRTGWLLEGEDPMYKKESGPVEPDYQTLRKQLSTALFSLQEAIQTLPQPVGPEISAVDDPAFRKPGKTKKTERQ